MNTVPEFHESTSRFGVRLEVEVRTGTLGIGIRPGHSVRLPIRDIEEARVATYSARDHGGWHWGVRSSPSGRSTVYRLIGSDGVALRLADGREIFLGSRRPRELQEALVRGAGHPDPGPPR